MLGPARATGDVTTHPAGKHALAAPGYSTAWRRNRNVMTRASMHASGQKNT